jgi:hypothetical protein
MPAQAKSDLSNLRIGFEASPIYLLEFEETSLKQREQPIQGTNPDTPNSAELFLITLKVGLSEGRTGARAVR